MRFTKSKQRRCLQLTVCCFGATAFVASAEDLANWAITAECQMIVLPQKAALRLIPLLNDDARIEGAYLELRELLKSGEAELAAELLAKIGGNGQAISKSVEEMRYANEYSPPDIPLNVPKEKQFETFKAWPVVAVTPTQFEVRNVGATLEFKAQVLGDGQWLNIAATPKHVRFQRWEKFQAGVLPGGATIGIQQPIFLSFGNETTAMVRNGRLMLLGVHKLPEPPATIELFLLRVCATKAE